MVSFTDKTMPPNPGKPLKLKVYGGYPQKPGSGFDIGITSNDNLYMVWYTYTPEGTPIWYLASGPLTTDIINGNSWNADLFE